MRCHMKKIFCLLFLVVFVFSFSTLSSAEEAEGGEGTVEILESAEDLADRLEEVGGEPFAPDTVEKTIFGKDGRITISNPSTYPFSAIAYMEVWGKCGHNWTGSGFMVDKDMLITAAHCIVCPTCSAWAKKANFYFGYKNARNYYYKYTGDWWAWAGNLFKNKEYTTTGDYAAIKLYKNVGNTTGWFGTWWNASETRIKNHFFYAAGYRDKTLKYDLGTVDLIGKNHEFLSFNMDTVPGNSGGPIFDTENYAVGIIIAGNSQNNIGYVLTDNVRNAMTNARNKKK